jgi:hypothetical protein
MNTINQAIKRAERLLPGTPPPEGKQDPRWQAIIAIGDYIENYPNEVWQFVEKWGVHPSQDLRAAIATVLLEHLLEYHFERVFPLVQKASLRSKRFAETFRYCFEFGQTLEPENQKRIAALRKMIQRKRANKALKRDAAKGRRAP